MKNIILNYSTLLKSPNILCYSTNNIKYWIPAYYLDSQHIHKIGLGSTESKKKLVIFLNECVSCNMLYVIGYENLNEYIDVYESCNYRSRTLIDEEDDEDSYIDVFDEYLKLECSLVTYLESKEAMPFDFSICFTDKDYLRCFNREKIKKVYLSDIKNDIKDGVVNKELLNKCKLIFEELGYFALKNIIPYLTGVSFMLLLYNYKVVFSFLASFKNMLEISALLFTIFIFWFRNNYRTSYGILEFIFGAALVFTEVEISEEITEINYFRLVSGVYVMIRGLDNIEKGLDSNIQLEIINTYWKRIFSQKLNI